MAGVRGAFRVASSSSSRLSPVLVRKKAWGVAWQVFVDATHAVWLAEVRPGGRSSRHRHDRKWNEFCVLSGRLRVCLWDRPGDARPRATHVLTAGRRLAVAPGVWHAFFAEGPAVVLEVYYARLRDDDIVRYDRGGVLPPPAKGAAGTASAGGPADEAKEKKKEKKEVRP